MIEADGTTRHLVDPVSERLAASVGPKTETRRASHVESYADLTDEAKTWLQDNAADTSDPNNFWADLSPVGGPVLGPHAAYADAIAAEVAWLQRHNIPYAVDATATEGVPDE